MRENPYPGVNAHLNSALQTPGALDAPSLWPSFHMQHIAQIAEALNATLPDQYIAMLEQSLQQRSPEFELGIAFGKGEKAGAPKPDVTVFARGEGNSPQPAPALLTPTWEAELTEVMEVDPAGQPKAVLVYEVQAYALRRIVARLEVLSPSNKPRGSKYEAYAARRVEALESGVPLIEIDYLHETPPTVRRLPRYPHDPNAYPYTVLVSDPRPDWDSGRVRAYGFGVAQPVCTFPLPLLGEEQLIFDLNTAYQRTLYAGRWNTLMNYATLPERFESYRADDQQTIRDVMAKGTG